MHQAEVRRAAGQPQRPHQGAPDAVWVVWHRRAVLLAPQGVVAPQPVLPQVQGAGLAPVQLWVLLPGEEADVEIEAGWSFGRVVRARPIFFLLVWCLGSVLLDFFRLLHSPRTSAWDGFWHIFSERLPSCNRLWKPQLLACTTASCDVARVGCDGAPFNTIVQTMVAWLRAAPTFPSASWCPHRQTVRWDF